MRLDLKKAAASLALLAASLGVTLVVAELAVRVLFPADKFYIWPPGMHLTTHPDPRYVGGVSPNARFSTNALGLRGDELSDDSTAYRVLVIGGSTSEMRYLDDAVAWPHLVQDSLARTADGRPVWVGSAGKAGMHARDHVVQVKFLLPQLPRMDAMVVLVGINDMTLALGDSQYTEPAPITTPAAEQRQLGRAFHFVPTGTIKPEPLRNRIALYRMYMRARNVLSWAKGQDPHIQDDVGRAYERWRNYRQRAERMLSELPDLEPALREYRRNLGAVVDQAVARGVRPILMTQPSAYHPGMSPAEERRIWLGGIGDFQGGTSTVYYTSDVLGRAIARFNATLLDVCRERAIDCIDLAAAVPADTTMFSDDVHFNELGSRRVAQAVTAWFRTQPPFR